MMHFRFTVGEERLCRFSMETMGQDVPEQRVEAKAEQKETKESSEALPSVDAAVNKAHSEIAQIDKDGVAFRLKIEKIQKFEQESVKQLAEQKPKLDMPGYRTAA